MVLARHRRESGHADAPRVLSLDFLGVEPELLQGLLAPVLNAPDAHLVSYLPFVVLKPFPAQRPSAANVSGGCMAGVDCIHPSSQ
jgi:hypothetical protein